MKVRRAVPLAIALALVGSLVAFLMNVLADIGARAEAMPGEPLGLPMISALFGMLAVAAVIFLAVLIWSSEWNPPERLRRAVLAAALLATGPCVIVAGLLAMEFPSYFVGFGVATVVALAILMVRNRVTGAAAAAAAVVMMVTNLGFQEGLNVRISRMELRVVEAQSDLIQLHQRADSIELVLDEHRLQIANLEAYLAQLARRADTR